MIVFDDVPVKGDFTQLFGVVSITGSIHAGLDIACYRAPVYCRAAGRVMNESEWINSTTTWHGNTVKSYGNAVALDHGEGIYSLYAHLESISVQPDRIVRSGDILGISGNTGVADGYHLHWQVSRTTQFPSGTAQNIDPLSLIKKGGLSVEDRDRLERLEKLLAKNGIDVWDDSTNDWKRLTGEEAIEAADAKGWSAFLGIKNTQQALKEHAENG